MSAQASQRVVLDNRLGELARVERWLADLVEAWGLSPKTAFTLDLLVNEAVTNVITHGYDDDLTHQIELTVADTEDALVVEVVDDGRPFNPLEAPPMVVGSDLEHASIGGRGIHLMRTYSKAQSYRYDSGANRLTLVLDKKAG
jgi:anti-sigma regulatory factor (Ser/Thr protein kinase)